jgi:HSP20 family molecular chaperone IbpA
VGQKGGDMKKLFIMFISIFLLSIGLVMSQTKKDYDPFEEFERIKKQTLEEIKKNGALSPSFFDSFFNDDFFSGRYNPWDLMERIRKDIRSSLNDREGDVFENYWNRFNDERFLKDETRIYETEDKKNVVVEIKIPGLKEKKLNISVKENYIKMSYEIENKTEKENKNEKSKSYSYYSYSKIIPVPSGVDTENYKTEIGNDNVKIIFPKKSSNSV